VEAAARVSGGEVRGPAAAGPTLAARVAELEAEVAALRELVARIEERLAGS
jgi:uncharacterized protein YceH (UPF0502 family)